MSSKRTTGRAQKRKEIDVTEEIFPKKEPTPLKEINWTAKQRLAVDTILDKDSRIIFLAGKAGTGKSTMAIFAALSLLRDQRMKAIRYIRVPVEAGSHGIGFLPASVNEKLAPYSAPGEEIISNLLSKMDLTTLKDTGVFSTTPVGFLRGLTFNDSVIIVEEASDFDIKSLELVMGRFGKNSKLIVLGDSRQASIRNSGFQTVVNAFNDEECRRKGIHVFEFGIEDCMRSPLTRFILDKFEKLNP